MEYKSENNFYSRYHVVNLLLLLFTISFLISYFFTSQVGTQSNWWVARGAHSSLNASSIVKLFSFISTFGERIFWVRRRFQFFVPTIWKREWGDLQVPEMRPAEDPMAT